MCAWTILRKRHWVRKNAREVLVLEILPPKNSATHFEHICFIDATI